MHAVTMVSALVHFTVVSRTISTRGRNCIHGERVCVCVLYGFFVLKQAPLALVCFLPAPLPTARGWWE
jgi:hypothetical protein